MSPLLVIGGKEITLWPPVSFRQGYTDLKKELILKNKLPKNLPRIKEMKIVVKARHLKKTKHLHSLARITDDQNCNGDDFFFKTGTQN